MISNSNRNLFHQILILFFIGYLPVRFIQEFFLGIFLRVGIVLSLWWLMLWIFLCSVCEVYATIYASPHTPHKSWTGSSLWFFNWKLIATVIYYVLIPISFIVIESKFSYNYSNVEMIQNKLLILTLFKFSSDLNFYSVSQITLVVLYNNFPHFSDQRPPH